MAQLNTKPILLFDGVCNLCNDSINFVIKKDPSAKISFASLQSDFAKKQLAKFNLPIDNMDTIYLIEDEQIFEQSTAALRTLRYLNLPWKGLYGFIIIPRFLRDRIYQLVSNNRYRWFGKKSTCMIPTEELRARFLD